MMTPASPLITPMSKVSNFIDPFVASLFDLPAVSPFPYPAEMSWDEKQEQARIARERKRYEASINEVTSELESMRTKVAELLEENNALPEAERMDVHEFELDVEEQQRRVNEGLDKEDDLRFELKAWQLSRHRIGQKIRKKVWDDMEVKGRSINGIQEIISVANYPMVPMDNQELDTLEEVMAERKLSKEVSKTAEFVTGAAPRLPKDPAKPKEEGDVDERLFGSRSYEFVDVASCLLYSQLEVTTRSQAKQQIVLLQEVVRKLKGHFNGIFDELYEFKNEKMRQINDWREALKSVLNELGILDGEEIRSLEKRLEWTPIENPALDLPPLVEDGGDPVQEEEEDEEAKKKKEKSEKQNEKEFEVEGDILKPEFMATKSMVDYAPAEISAVEQYEVKKFSLK